MSKAMAFDVDPSNSRQLRDWDGEHGSYWAEYADFYDRGVACYHPALLAAANPGPGDRILDVGCGSGQVAIDLVRASPGSRAVGVDLSSAQLEVARQRGAGLAVKFAQADAQVHDFGAAAYDLIVSRTGTMFSAMRRQRSPTWPRPRSRAVGLRSWCGAAWPRTSGSARSSRRCESAAICRCRRRARPGRLPRATRPSSSHCWPPRAGRTSPSRPSTNRSGLAATPIRQRGGSWASQAGSCSVPTRRSAPQPPRISGRCSQLTRRPTASDWARLPG